jgi:low density lipoprotein-related protein 2
LVFANRFYIRNLTLETKQYTRLNSEHSYTHALDYDYRERKIYYFDAGEQKSKSMNFDGSEDVVLQTHYAAGVEGIAFDWIAKNIYWTSNRLKGVYVSNNEGRFVRSLARFVSPNPRAIVVHPGIGYLYWTDWSYTPMIAKMGMDGSGFEKIITEGLFWPNGLAIDHVTNRLWWVDAHLDKVEYADIDGSNRHVVKVQVPHGYSIDIFEEWMFWSEWNVKRIEMANRFTGANHSILLDDLEHLPYGMRVIHKTKQPKFDNPCEKAECSHLCLLSPGDGEKASYKCGCPNEFSLDSDQKTCIANCTSEQFACKGNDAKCIPKLWYCDGESDCEGEEDEPETCPNRFCLPGQFECKNSTMDSPDCTINARLCDTIAHCDDGSDEDAEFCQRPCQPNQFRCNSGQCIPANWACDFEDDCADGTDESPHNPQCESGECSDSEFTCNNKKCIPKLWYCDWDDDCGDNSDEPHDECWKTRECPDGWTECRTNYRCVPTTALCDGNDDCRDNSDEEPEKCIDTCDDVGDFKCNNTKCIPERWVCDRQNDCGDGTDEKETYCRCEPGTQGCFARKCSEMEFTCGNRNCIRIDNKCNHVNDCGDNSDENVDMCKDHPGCGEDEWQCKSGHCILDSWKCDRERDCLYDASDELDCKPQFNGSYCPPNEFACNNHVCIDTLWVCDGEDDCGDGSDETSEECKKVECSDTFYFRCQNSRCIYKWLICDDVDDCGDGSDENDLKLCEAKPRPCTAHEFQCANKRCVNMTQVCDSRQKNDCGDGSDEFGCYRDVLAECNSAKANISCSQKCLDLDGRGFACYCDEGYKPSLSHHAYCEDLDECAHWGHYCSQKCINEKGTYTCQCYNGFDKDANITGGRSCNTHEGHVRRLIAAIGSNINQFFFPTSSSASEVGAMVVEEKSISDLTLDPKSQMVWWVDVADKKVKRAKIPRSTLGYSDTQDLEIPNLSEPRGIAYDWYSKNIYFSDTRAKRIYMSRADGNFVRTVVKTVGLPTSIAVNPILRKVFWIERMESGGLYGSIRSAYLDGTDVQDVLTNLQSPSGLTIDYYMNGRLFWLDQIESLVETVNHDGSDRALALRIKGSKLLTLDVFEDSLYFGVVQSNGNSNILRQNKFGHGVNETVWKGAVAESVKFLHDLRYPLPNNQNFPNNACAAENCNALCVNMPLGAQCLCPDGTEVPGNPSSGRYCDLDKINYVVRAEPLVCEGCKNGGFCVRNETNQYTCKCPKDYEGSLCDSKVTATTASMTPTTTPATKSTTPQPVPTSKSSPQTSRPTSSTITSTSSTRAVAIAIPIMIVVLILLAMVLITLYMMRTGKLKSFWSKDGPSGRAEYRSGSAGGAAKYETNRSPVIVNSISDTDAFAIDTSGIANPMYDAVEGGKSEGYVSLDTGSKPEEKDPGYSELKDVTTVSNNNENITDQKPSNGSYA